MFDLSIDLNTLDTEWLEQAERFYEVATQAAESKREVERTKLALDIAEAELDNDIRANPVKYGIAKITEGAIASAIKLAKPYQDAVNTHADAQLHNNHMQSGVQAFDQRKKALENLVYLQGQSYFAGPNAPRTVEQVRSSMKSKRDIRNPKEE